ncbi:(2Fe-2S) ferredoxin domain-containing protein [Phormidesmis sp. 146-35]
MKSAEIEDYSGILVDRRFQDLGSESRLKPCMTPPLPPPSALRPSHQSVRICQHNSCRKSGSAKVLAAFRANPVEGVEVVTCGCFGQCGNGPMVLVFPEQVWYSRVHPDEVKAIVDRHLKNGTPISALLYRKFHPA